MSDLQAKILSNGAGVVATKPPLRSRDPAVVLAGPPKRHPPPKPESHASVPSQFALSDRFSGLRDAPLMPQVDAAPAQPESAAPALTPLDDPDQAVLNTSGLLITKSAAEAGPPRRAAPTRLDSPASEPLQPEVVESAAPVLVAARPPGPTTDQDVVDKLLQLAEQPPGERDREALGKLSGLLASHDFDFSSMSATNVARMHKALHGDGVAQGLGKAEVKSFLKDLDSVFSARFSKAIDDEAIAFLAREVGESQTPQAREALAHAIAQLPHLAIAKLFVALQRIPGALDMHEDPVILKIAKTFPYLNSETFDYLRRESKSLSPQARTVLGEQLAAGKQRIQLQLMKQPLELILNGVRERDPSAISGGVEAAKKTQASFLALLPANVPILSGADQLESLQNLITAALRPEDATASKLVLLGKTAAYLPTGQVVVKSDKNDVSKVANSYFHGFTQESRDETSNVKLFGAAVTAAARKR